MTSRGRRESTVRPPSAWAESSLSAWASGGRGLVAGDAARVFRVAHPREDGAPGRRAVSSPDIEVKADGQTGEKVGELLLESSGKGWLYF